MTKINDLIEWMPESPNKDEDDFTAICGHYTLRAEQMDKHYWWWCVYFKNESIAFNDPVANTKEQAMSNAEKEYRLHVKENCKKS